jgi:hypothetical protein
MPASFSGGCACDAIRYEVTGEPMTMFNCHCREDAGASWKDIIDATVFLTNMKKDFPTYNRIYAEYFAGDGKPNPTRTTIEVTALSTPDRDRAQGDPAVGK